MASVEDQHNNQVYNDDDLDDDVVDEEDDDVDVDDDDDEDSTSSPPAPTPAPVDQRTVTIAVVGVPAQRINEFAAVTPPPTAATIVEEKKPSAIDDSRKLFQRLWTDEDEIELLQGFLEYTTQRGGINSSSHHHDTTAFYDQIKSKLQLDFNKNQLVEKLRRLKKKYRNVMSKMASGKDFVFKSSHDQATFEISRKIWSNAVPVVVRGGGSAAAPPPPPEDGGFDDEDSHLNLNANFVDHSHNGIDIKTPRSRKRSRGGAVKVEEKHGFIQHYYLPSLSGGGTNMSSHAPAPAPAPAPVPVPAPGFTPFPMTAPQATAPPTTTAAVAASAAASIPSLIEETVRSCLSPIFKELLNNVTNLSGSRSFGFGMALSPIPLGFGSSGAMNSDMMADEKWRKQQMLELEVYSRRLELVQDQIKAQLEELRSMNT